MGSVVKWRRQSIISKLRGVSIASFILNNGKETDQKLLKMNMEFMGYNKRGSIRITGVLNREKTVGLNK